ncbi:dihydroorotase [Oscillibacter valericigenes]|uniref:dihydroorotase n=1 Tax=Oscillibacter valericigenes TaxID=351091 RepID=UPI001F2D9D60|nr:dihydroorotase [Oscillibacter valericigenes]MCF2665130.1 dihydroorotase [Oscillibacter valericigenes]
MSLLLTGGAVFLNGSFQNMDLAIDQGRIVSVSPSQENTSVIELHNRLIVPGFVDVHVHLREPGFSYKETIFSGTAAAAAGGYTAVCSMPNLKPVPDNADALGVQLDLVRKNAKVRVYPYGAITRGEKGEELADLTEMAPDVAGFSDDGRGVQSREMMRQAMLLAKSLDKPIVAHSEDESLLTKGWAIHDGDFARRNGFPGNDPANEWKQVERDIQLVRETGCQYHVCHISTKESVALIRAAKAEGLPVTCETGPHYLVLCDEDLLDEGRFKMNPPIRSAEDRDALVAGLLDGTVDCIATDHAPHSAEEKSKGLRGSLNGIVGLETAFPILYTNLVETGIVPLETILNALCVNPRRIFGLPGGSLEEGQPADLTVLDLNRPHIIDSSSFRSLGRATPFDGWGVSAAVAMTICGGEIVYHDLNTQEDIV